MHPQAQHTKCRSIAHWHAPRRSPTVISVVAMFSLVSAAVRWDLDAGTTPSLFAVRLRRSRPKARRFNCLDGTFNRPQHANQVAMTQPRPPVSIFIVLAVLCAAALPACSTNSAMIDGSGSTTSGSPTLGAPAVTGTASLEPLGQKPATGSVPASTLLPRVEPSPPNPSSGGASSTTIVGYREPSIILYESESGNNGRRIESATLPALIKIRSASADGTRYEIVTVQGARWVAKSKVTVAPSTP